ncbi:polysaccharide pyruvyl transferase family protein [Bacillus timonensis]|nr:polysaccharide pyruvyl transferase family protein [Bacillus timonensis]
MKIGTITFHWATNYGAVLQAFALQKYLKDHGYETEIINYIPFNITFKQLLLNLKTFNKDALLKEYKIKQFRKYNLDISKKKYYTNRGLIEGCQDYDIFICGSDQVWNEWFLMNSEKKYNLSYYLNFVDDSKKRISYATSFGSNELSNEAAKIVKKELKRFSEISVRENSGKKIVESLECNAVRVLDPTLLIDRNIYDDVIGKIKEKDSYQLFSYILHDDQKTAHKINQYIFERYFDTTTNKIYNKEPIGIPEWLSNIKNAKFVVTNSFHGVVFSIVFQTPFLVVPVENSGMNDRMLTLLNSLNLNNRIVDKFEKQKINELYSEVIDWDSVEQRLTTLKRNSRDFLTKAIGNK